MRALLLVLFALTCQTALAARDPAVPTAAADAPGAFIVLCYHEVRRDVRDFPDPFAVDEGALVAQFSWLRANGYTPVSIDQILAARGDGKALPPKAVLLTFDDGYLSFYTSVYPLLREFGYPAVLAIVGTWIDAPPAGTAFGEKGTVTAARFPTWGQLREMAASGLVEMGSHSYDLHRGVVANPQGNLEPAATARIYDPTTGRYETDANWHTRIRGDLARNADAIERGTGRRPRVIAWPYGHYNEDMMRMAAELGSPIALTLGEGVNTPSVPLNAVRRILIGHNPGLAAFVSEVRGPQFPEPVRVVAVDLDDLYSPDTAEQDRNLSSLLDRIQGLKPTHVYLKALSGPAGAATAAYFPNRHLPVRADFFNRVAWQLSSRTDVKVFAHLPSMLNVELYEDIARHAAFEGLVLEASIPPALRQQIVARVRALRAPLTVALIVETAPKARRIEHVPAYAGDATHSVTLLDSAGADSLAPQMRALQLGGKIDFGYTHRPTIDDDQWLGKLSPSMSLRPFPPPVGGRQAP